VLSSALRCPQPHSASTAETVKASKIIFLFIIFQMLVADEFASVSRVLKSTVGFPLDLFASRRMANSACEMGANRTFMLVGFEVTTGSPFECAHPIVIGCCSRHSFIGFNCGILSFHFRRGLNSAKRANARKRFGGRFFADLSNCRRATAPAGGKLFSSADNFLTTRSRIFKFSDLALDLIAVAG